MHADPERWWDISTMTIKEALASKKGKAVKAAIEEEMRSLLANGTWELVPQPHGINVIKNWWVLTTKFNADDTVAREKARLVVKGFTQICGADYDEMYSPVGSYVTLRIFLSIVVALDRHVMQLDMKNAYLQSNDQHWRDLDCCIDYMVNTRDFALKFGNGLDTLHLMGYADSDDAGDWQTCSSASRYVFVLGGAAVAWASQKIKCMTLSSMESEYIAATKAGKEASVKML
ncbi:unnamed protein product [Closterium sp. NIES-54]